MRIFFGHGHDKNSYIVERHNEELITRGYEVWADQSKIRSGDDWRSAISKEINESDIVMSFASKYAFRDHGLCINELSVAVADKVYRFREFFWNRMLMCRRIYHTASILI